MTRVPKTVLSALVLPVSLCAADALGAPRLEDYKYFRTLTIDLMGRMPTRQEVEQFEQPDFNLNAWIEQNLEGDGYAERLTRVYADLLRPQINNFRYTNNRNSLASVTFKAPNGSLTRLYYRPTQQRARIVNLRATLNADTTYRSCSAIRDPVNDPQYKALGCEKYEKYDNLIRAGMCLQADEIGIRHNNGNFAPTPFPALPTDKPGDAPRVGPTQALLDQYTTVIKPWWLYADYKSETPTQRFDASSWAQFFPGYVLSASLLKEPDNKTDVQEIRVCNEELSTERTAVADTLKILVSCETGFGAANASGCGCGQGLEHCMPAATFNTTFPAATFVSSRNVLLGVDDPTDQVGFSLFDWHAAWLGEEPQVYIKDLFRRDGDLREIVTGRHTFVNGPLAQFYRFSAKSYTTDPDLGETPLPKAEALPQMLPHDVMKWERVADRGANAAGVLTMPFFLYKNATRRARAHVVYNVFVCRDFVAPTGLQLPVSKEPNLMLRAGCASCHQTLEPLSAYFARFPESDWNWLDPKFYPTQNIACKQGTNGQIPGGCNGRYDNQFSSKDFGMLRGAYGAPQNADLGAQGIGQFLASKPEFASCAVDNIAQSFLGRELRTEDAELKQQLISAMTQNGFRVRPMVRVLLNSNAYRSANNLTPSVWRDKGGAP